ncbi:MULTISPECIES: SDR family NAD(P)-dependent oxidoreductase [Actinosynnema]|uniref:SDR family NAD(P)-dependent oxidoreductase n=1 Tax=Actinosynnema TaxID=40566 RepID=UPI0020A55E23|nr:SDR family NAD(P)-dependent oxidoreductase [Actinosynnema pretiosum]
MADRAEPALVPWVVSGSAPLTLRAGAVALQAHLVGADRHWTPGGVGRSLAARPADAHRAVLLCREPAEFLAALTELASGTPSARVVTAAPAPGPGPVLVFPGQGPQWPGMAALADAEPVFRAALVDCCAAFAPFLDRPLPSVLDQRTELEAPELVQPALFAVMVALAALWRSRGVEPSAVLGHSAGEFAAAHVAGALPLDEAARALALWSRAQSELAGRGEMIAAALPAAEVRALLPRWAGALDLAATNSPRSTVVAGDRAAALDFLAHCRESGVPARRLAIGLAAHSAQVDALRESLLTDLAPIRPREAEIPLHSSTTGGQVDGRSLDAAHWFANLRGEVRFADATRALLDGGHRLFLEVGPHPVLGPALLETAHAGGVPDVAALATLRRGGGGEEDFLTALAEAHVRGADVDWTPVFASDHPVLLPEPPRSRHAAEPDGAGWGSAGQEGAEQESGGWGSAGSESAGWGVAGPGSAEPWAAGPETADWDFAGPRSAESGATGSESADWDFAGPRSAESGAIGPGSADWGVAVPETAESGAAGPQSAERGATGWEAAERATAEHGAAEPGGPESLAPQPMPDGRADLGKRALRDLVRVHLTALLPVGSPPPTDSTSFWELGLDSGAVVRFRDRITAATGVPLPATLLFDHPTPGDVVAALVAATAELPARTAEDEPIAVVAVARRFPGDTTAQEDPAPPLHPAPGTLLDPEPADFVPAGATPADPDSAAFTRTGSDPAAARNPAPATTFDPTPFGPDPREVGWIDPRQRQLLETTGEVFERAGLPQLSRGGARVGVFTRAELPTTSDLVATVFGLRGGPSTTADPTRSSPLAPLHLAVRALRSGDCALALAGGETGRDGGSDGVAVLLLERLADARRGGHPVLALVRGPAADQVDPDPQAASDLVDVVELVLALHDAAPSRTALPRTASSRSGDADDHLVLEPAPPPVAAHHAPVELDPVPWVLSAATAEDLREQARRLAAFATGGASTVDIGRTLAVTREALPHRAVVLGGDDHVRGLDLLADGISLDRVITGRARERRVVFAFPGDRTPWTGAAEELLRDFEVFRAAIAECDEALRPHTGWSLTAVLLGDPDAPPQHRDDVLQPVQLAVAVGLAALWRAHGVEPDAVLGHGAGELAAAHVAGALTLDEAAGIAAVRGEFAHPDDRHDALLTRLGGIHPRRAPIPLHRATAHGATARRAGTGTPPDLAEPDARHWSRDLHDPAGFDRATRALLATGHDLVVEISPHPEPSAILTRAGADVIGALGRGGTAGFTRSLAEAHVRGARVDWTPLFGAGPLVDLPAHAFQHAHRHEPDNSTTRLLLVPSGRADHPAVAEAERALGEVGTAHRLDLDPADVDRESLRRALDPAPDLVVSFLALDETPHPEHPEVPRGLAATLALLQVIGDVPLRVITTGQALPRGLAETFAVQRPESRVVPLDLTEHPFDALPDLLLAPVHESTGAPAPDGAVLVLGGHGERGRSAARAFTRAGAPHVVLACRRGADAPGAIEFGAELVAGGARVTHARCDVTQPHDLARLVVLLAEQGERVRTVVHAAGPHAPRPVAELDLAALASAVRTGIVGACNLVAPARFEPAPASRITTRTGDLFPAPDEETPAAQADPGVDDRIAVLAAGCRLPGGIRTPDDLRHPGEAPTTPTDRGWTGVTGAYLDRVALFDADFFGLTPDEARAADPAQRLLLETAWEAVERAGIDPTSLRGSRTGVFTDQPGRTADLVSRVLGLPAPAESPADRDALRRAVRALRSGECELALVGSATALPEPPPAGSSPAEHAVVLLLEPLATARHHDHPVLGVAEPTGADLVTTLKALLEKPFTETDRPPAGPPSGAVVPWVLSAAEPAALRARARDLLALLDRTPDVDPVDVGFALATGRSAFPHRAVLVGATADRFRAGLSALADRATDAPATPRSPVFTFPGQTARRPAPVDDLLADSPVFRDRIAECERALAPHVDWSLTAVLRGDPGAPPPERADVAQPVQFAVAVALAEVWRAHGVEPAAVLGHGHGEIAAAHVAGALSLADAARVVAVRSRLLHEHLAGAGGLVAVSADPEDVAEALGELEIASVDGPGALTASGAPAALEAFLARCADRGWRAKWLPVDHAPHSHHVDPLLDLLRAELHGIRPLPGRIPLWSPVTGGELDPTRLGPDHWADNLRLPVRFDPTTRALLDAGHDLFVEVAPNPVLSHQVQLTASDHGRPARVVGALHRDGDGRERLLSALGEAHALGADVSWERAFTGLDPRRADLPTYPFQGRRHWQADRAARSAPTYRLDWRELTPGPAGPSGRWLVAAPGESVLAEALRDRFTALGAEVVRFDPDAPHRAAGSPDLAGVVAVPPADLAWTLALLRDLGDAGITAPLWCCTRTAAPLGPQDPARATTWGFGQVAAQELARRWGGLIDLPPVAGTREFDLLAGVLTGATGEDRCAIRDGRVLVPRLVPAEPPAPLDFRPERGTVLVTGAFGRTGGHVARWLARSGAEHLLLVDVTDRAEPALIAELTSVGARVTTATCDLADREALRALLASVPEHTPLTGVVHAATAGGDAPVDALDPARVAEALDTGFGAALALHELVGDLPLFALVSSLDGTVGTPGRAVSAAVGSGLDALARHRVSLGSSATAIAWEGDQGPVTTALGRALAHDVPVVIAAEVDWEALRAGLTRGAILTELVAEKPEPEAEKPELVAETSELVAETSELVAENSEPEADTSVRVAEPPALVAETPEPVAETPELMADTSALVADTSAPEAETPARVAETPEPEAETSALAADTSEPVAETSAHIVAAQGESDEDAPLAVIAVASRAPGEVVAAEDFDTGFFGLTPAEALVADPRYLLLLETAQEACERAGLDPEALRGQAIGVFLGVAHRAHPTPGGVVAGQLAHRFGLVGPAITADTEHSSSLIALHLAAQSLRRHECDLALAAGADVTEGAGVLLLARRSDADRDGHPALALLRGSATSSNDRPQQDVVRRVLADQPQRTGSGIVHAVEVVLALRDDLPADDPCSLTEPVEWATVDGRRRAGVSSFATGANAHVILEAAPVPPHPERGEPGVVPWVLSARTPEALRVRAERLRAFLAANPEVEPVDVARALTRTRFEHRAVLTGVDHQDFLPGLEALAQGRAETTATARHDGVAVRFGGRSGQADERALTEAFPALDRELRLARAELDQSAGTVLQVALFRLLRSWGVEPARLISDPDGETAALRCADATTPVVRVRAREPLPDRGHVLDLAAVTDPHHLMSALGHLHGGGAHVDWDAVLAGRRPSHVDLPTHPFQRHHPTPEPDVAEPRREAKEPPHPAGDLLRLEWCPVPLGAPATDPVVWSPRTAATTTEDAVRDLTEQGFARVGDWLADPERADTRLVVLTSGAVGPGATDLAGAALWGLLRAAQSEHPGRFTLVDADDPDLGVLSAAVATGEPQLLLREGRAHAARLTRVPATAAAAPRWRGTVLVTGGTGVVGRALATHLARAGAEHLVLASRTGPNHPDTTALVAELTAEGAAVTVVACDVTDRPAVSALLDQIPDDQPLTAVVHAAAIPGGSATTLTPERLTAAVPDPAVTGTLLLHELTRRLDLTAFVLCSSASGTLGGLGRAEQAVAGAFLDAFASSRADADDPVVSLAWGPWNAPEGHLLPPADPTALFDAALTSGEPVLLPTHLAPLDHTAPPLLRDLTAPQTGGSAATPPKPAGQETASPQTTGQETTPPQTTPPQTAAPQSAVPLIAAPQSATPDTAARQSAVPQPAAPQSTAPDTAQPHTTGQETTTSRTAQPPTLPSPRHTLRRRLAEADPGALLLAEVREQVARVLGRDDVPEDARFPELGVTPASALEIRNRLERTTELRLPATLLHDHPTPRALADHLRARTAPDRTPASPLADLARVRAALPEVLSDGRARARVAAELAELSALLAPVAVPEQDPVALRLRDAGDAEVFEFIDKELGL